MLSPLSHHLRDQNHSKMSFELVGTVMTRPKVLKFDDFLTV